MKAHGHHNTGVHGFNTLGFYRENPMAASLYWSLSMLRKGAAFIPFCEADHCVALTPRAPQSPPTHRHCCLFGKSNLLSP
ncbi:MAG: hypothetical protein ACRCT2_10600, partial [Plesiomonas shigelloides]